MTADRSQARCAVVIAIRNLIATISRSRALWATMSMILITTINCHAENCPWLNAATAGGAMGGTVATSLIHTTREDVTCEFKLKRDNNVATLTIAVHTMASPAQDFSSFQAACGTSATPLRGIGNEAIECSSPAPHGSSEGATTETIVARVRDRAFVLKWTFPPASDSIPVVPRDELQDKIRNLAEQIAGSLF